MATPDTTPDDEPTVATAVDADAQVPPETEDVSVCVAPTHIPVPTMIVPADETGSTVTIADELHPVGNV